MVEWLRTPIFSALNHSSSHCCGFEPSSGHVRQAKFCLRVVRWFFSGISCFCPTSQLTQLKMSEIILMGRKTLIKMKEKRRGSNKLFLVPILLVSTFVSSFLECIISYLTQDEWLISFWWRWPYFQGHNIGVTYFPLKTLFKLNTKD